MIERAALLEHLRLAMGRSRIVALTGPRQCGKTTLARELLPAESPGYFDLEDPASLARLDEPMTALRDLKGLVVIVWATHGGAEMDLLLIKNGRMAGVECKRMDAPRLTPSIHIAMEDLKLDQVAIVYPGARRYPLAERVQVVPLQSLAEGGAEALFGNR